ncbi:alpha/beta hydrolase [Mycolicibacterium moriokaense]|nr:alpha/beta hydrolase [Mycolicibacterium moriokaense]
MTMSVAEVDDGTAVADAAPASAAAVSAQPTTPIMLIFFIMVSLTFRDAPSRSGMGTGLVRSLACSVTVFANNSRQHTGEAMDRSPTVRALRFARRITDALGLDVGVDLAPLISTRHPPVILTRALVARAGEFEGIPTVTIRPNRSGTGNVIVAVPGGAYVVRPTVMHWLLYAMMARRTGATVVVPVYPLATDGGSAGSVVPSIADLIASHSDSRVGVYGDSAGGGLVLAAVQRLVADGRPVPTSLVLVSPFLDVTMSNPAIASVDDPVLDPASLRKSGLMWAGALDPKDPLVSPLYGSLAGLPPTRVFSGSRDVLYPDVVLLRQRAEKQSAPMDFDLRDGLVHNWAMLPVTKEGRAVLPDILRVVGG